VSPGARGSGVGVRSSHCQFNSKRPNRPTAMTPPGESAIPGLKPGPPGVVVQVEKPRLRRVRPSYGRGLVENADPERCSRYKAGRPQSAGIETRALEAARQSNHYELGATGNRTGRLACGGFGVSGCFRH